MLSEIQQAEFEKIGVLRLSRVFSETAAQYMSEQIWRLLAEEYGIRPDDSATWKVKQPTGFQALTRSRVFDSIVSEVLTEALDELLGGKWEKPRQWGAPLVTFPDQLLEWKVPHRQWHLD